MAERVETLGELLRHARQRAGLSQKDVASALGFARQYLNEVETDRASLGRAKLMKATTLLNIDYSKAARAAAESVRRRKLLYYLSK